jgi:multicomponent Na+:H+ antiporter subunit G
MSSWIDDVLLLIGGSFMLIAAIGILRMPDLLSRMQTATKASSLGLGAVILAVGTHFGEPLVIVRALAIIAFGFITVPIAAHMLGRAAYFVGEPLWEGTLIDELRGQYDKRTHELRHPALEEVTPGGPDD